MSTQLTALKCKKCNKVYIPPKYLCTECSGGELEEVKISGQGKVYTFTTIRVPPTAYKDSPPYDLGIIELENGLRLTARMTNGEGKEMKIGSTVSFVQMDERGNWVFKLS
jgi:scaffold protein (connect acetoacetyl-CoA thiolase and HMG-CoA synthase)